MRTRHHGGGGGYPARRFGRRDDGWQPDVAVHFPDGGGDQWINEGSVEGHVEFVGEGPHPIAGRPIWPSSVAGREPDPRGRGGDSWRIGPRQASVETEHADVEGTSGLTSQGGDIAGSVLRRYDWTKTKVRPPTRVGPGVEGAEASAFADQPGAVYVKQWVESGTTYRTLVASDGLDVQEARIHLLLPAGNYTFNVSGTPVVSPTTVNVSAEAASASLAWLEPRGESAHGLRGPECCGGVRTRNPGCPIPVGRLPANLGGPGWGHWSIQPGGHSRTGRCVGSSPTLPMPWISPSKPW